MCERPLVQKKRLTAGAGMGGKQKAQGGMKIERRAGPAARLLGRKVEKGKVFKAQECILFEAYAGRMNKKISIGIIAIFLIAVVVVAGCVQKAPVYSNESKTAESKQIVNSEGTAGQKQAPKMATLDMPFVVAKNWDADAEVDGLEATLEPKDAADNIVAVNGIISAVLWKVPDIELDEATGEEVYVNCDEYTPRDRDIVGRWSGIKVSAEDIDPVFGVDARLGYPSNLSLAGSPTGYLKVTFTTEDGNSFEATYRCFLMK